jgi:hypothetical protein
MEGRAGPVKTISGCNGRSHQQRKKKVANEMMRWWWKGFNGYSLLLLIFCANRQKALAFQTTRKQLPQHSARLVQSQYYADHKSSAAESSITSRRRRRLISIDPLSASSSSSNDQDTLIKNYNNPLNNKPKNKNDEFWSQQQALADELQRSAAQSLKQEQREMFKQKRLALVYDTAYISALIFATCWLLSNDPFTAWSYLPGAVLGLAYSYGLGKSVEKIGANPMDLVDNNSGKEEAGSGLGDARFAFLILLFLLLGKFQSQGLQPLPAIAGFFTYQLASLKQGLQEMD